MRISSADGLATSGPAKPHPTEARELHARARMVLEEYRRKRDFKRTPEPRGRTSRRKASADQPLTFVVQKHAATQLHYDFRLELGGTLKSWAVPKGPSLDPRQRRLAVHVEDHPLEYGDFEGTIPEGSYGAGTVIVWDRGEWVPEGDPETGFRAGRLRFELKGRKLRGAWRLVRMGSDGSSRGRDNWLLMKAPDDQAKRGAAANVVDTAPKSVASGRTLEQVARNPERAWHSDRNPAEASVALATKKLLPGVVEGARKARFPGTVEPQLATLVSEAPDGDEWLHELKLDGYRLLAKLRSGQATLLTRHGQDWTARFGPIAQALAALPVETAVLDGEAVLLKPDGTTDFQALQNALSASKARGDLVYFLFDLLYLDGYDLTGVAQVRRKELLSSILDEAAAAARGDGGTGASPVRLSEHVVGRGPEVFARACELGVEGIVAKRADARYRPGRNRNWLKVKCSSQQEFVIVGWTDPSGSRSGLGSLLLGYYEDRNQLRYCGKVGTGFTQHSLAELRRKLEPLSRKDPPVVGAPRKVSGRQVHWAEPRLVAEVAFTGWTRDGVLRHPSFKGLREDLDPRGVRRERAEGDGAEAGSTSSSTSRSRKAPGKAGASRARARAKAEKDSAAASEKGRARAAAGATTARNRRGARAVQVAGVRLSTPDRVYYPEAGITKLELARYYEAVSEFVLADLAHRPLTLVRCPQGRTGDCFYQKHVDRSFPASIRRLRIREAKATRTYFSLHTLDALIHLVQMGTLEFHTWGARDDRIERPDRLIFDLDPGPGVAWSAVLDAARLVRHTLQELGLTAYVKTTGGKGLHVIAPLVRRRGWDELKAFARAVAERIASADPRRFTTDMSKAKRRGRIYVDYLRNSRGATAIAAYSTRSRPGAPVSVPLRWDELVPSLDPVKLSVRSVPGRLKEVGDAWAGMSAVRQSITAAMLERVQARG